MAGTSDQPPGPPEFQPRIRVAPAQLVGIVLLGMLPVLAVFGVFGRTTAEATAMGSAVELRVKYPTRFRYKTIDTLEVRVRNTSDRALDRVTVTFDDGYIEAFSEVHFTPSVERAYEVELANLQPGEERLISVGIQAEAYWRHRGKITATSGGDSVEAPVQTFTFP